MADFELQAATAEEIDHDGKMAIAKEGIEYIKDRATMDELEAVIAELEVEARERIDSALKAFEETLPF